MDTPGSGPKKIVFKKRAGAVQASANEPTQQPEVVVPDEHEAAPDDRSVYHFQGEIFDQFYRPLKVAGGEERLAELALEILAPPAPGPRRGSQERISREKELQGIAETLADHIYELAQKIRESELDVYLSAFNVVLADRSCLDAKEILDRANDYFTERYYAAIRERGERPEIYQQIVKRVGHEHAERIGKIVRGLDLPGTAKALWDLYHGPDPSKASRIHEILLDCTEKQVRALREEFLLIPYKDLARQLHEVILAGLSDTPTEVKRTIGKSEVHDQRRQFAFRSRDKLRAVRYLLLGRSTAELALVKRFFEDLGDPDAPNDTVSMESQIKRAILQVDIDRMGSLQLGWSAAQEADEINQLLFPPTIAGALDDFLSDPRDAVDRDFTQGIGPFLRRFKKHRMFQDQVTVYQRIMNCYEVLTERVAAMSAERFLQTNEALAEQFGYDLDPNLFPSLARFDARRMAMVVHQRMAHSFDLFEIIRPIEFLAPRACLALQRAYESIYGVTLRQAIQERLAQLRVQIAARDFDELYNRYVNGHGRWPLNIDLLARYRGEEPEPGVWDYDYHAAPEDEERAISLAQLIDQDTDRGELDAAIQESLVNFSYEELNRIERSFYDLTDPHVPLRHTLEECLSDQLFNAVELRLAGLEIEEILPRIHDNPGYMATFSDLPPSCIDEIRRAFKRQTALDLVEYVMQHFSEPEQEERLVEVVSVVLMPEVYQFRVALQGLRKDSPVEGETLKKEWDGPIARVLAFERGFDVVFPRLRVLLKQASARMVLSVQAFVHLILSLEGVSTDVLERIQECFDSVDIFGLQGILAENKHHQVTIEECYDLLNPETQFRRAIKEMKVDLDLINETLLHIEGFHAREVALEVAAEAERVKGSALGQVCLEILAAPTPTRANPRIPVDINWMDEMIYQIALSYQREVGKEFIDSLRQREVPGDVLEELTGRVFGHEVCSSARELFTIIKNNKEGAPNADQAEEKICALLEWRGSRHRERMMKAYNAYWGHTPGYSSLLDGINRHFLNPAVKKRLVTLLLGATAVSSPQRVNVADESASQG